MLVFCAAVKVKLSQSSNRSREVLARVLAMSRKVVGRDQQHEVVMRLWMVYSLQ